jgi:hypothetical protein
MEDRTHTSGGRGRQDTHLVVCRERIVEARTAA